jgi:hypothetical protein
MAVKLIYQMFAKALSWMVLHVLWVPRTASPPFISAFAAPSASWSWCTAGAAWSPAVAFLLVYLLLARGLSRLALLA